MPNHSERLPRIAIIGAGPIGLEAALRFQTAGFNAHVFEAGRVAENVRDWGHVRLFSPFAMNTSALGRSAVARDSAAEPLPEDGALLSGDEFASRYLLPLAGCETLAGRIHEQSRVVAIGRARLTKTDSIGSSRRADDPFQLLLRDARGERTARADVVLDCSGTYPHHRWIGAGGVPCIGESTALEPRDYRLPDIGRTRRDDFSGRTTLVVGSGYSAATAVVALASLAESAPATKVVWITRAQTARPLGETPGDPLPERARLTQAANRLAQDENSPVRWLPGRSIHRIAYRRDSGSYLLHVSSGDETEQGSELGELVVDRVIATVGYRPDRTLSEELQFHECYATQGPMKLAAALLGEQSGDCLSQASHGANALCSPEPNYFVLGAKSYGRDSRFLIRVGLEQIEDVFGLIASRLRGER